MQQIPPFRGGIISLFVPYIYSHFYGDPCQLLSTIFVHKVQLFTSGANESTSSTAAVFITRVSAKITKLPFDWLLGISGAPLTQAGL